MPSVREEPIETDLLVIGGGLAGAFAAIKAKEAGCERVTIVSKGSLGKDSISSFAAGAFTMIFPEDDRGDLIKMWGLSEAYGAGIYDEEWLNVWLQENYDRIGEMDRWGVEWEKTPDGKFERKTGRFAKMVGWFHGSQMMKAMAKKVRASGVQVVGHTMITDLLTKNGEPGSRVDGAIGFDVRTGAFRVFKARATILAAGGCGLKSRFSSHRFQTGEAIALAFRAGATLGRFETGERIHTTAAHFDTHGLIFFVAQGGRFVNALGEPFMEAYDPELKDFASMSSVSAASAFEVRAGRGPIYLDLTGFTPETISKLKVVIPHVAMILERAGVVVNDRIVKKVEWAPAFYATIGTGGGAVTNTKCETSLPGLYACGDAMSRPPHFAALPGASISGARAGRYAAEYVATADKPRVSKSQVARLREFAFSPLEQSDGAGDGVDPDHITLGLHETLLPYEVTVISRGDRMQKAIREVERIKEEELPLIYALDPHYLRLANETRSMVLVSELYLKSRLLREESREGCLREDFPYTDNVDWLKWSMLKQEDGKIKLWTEDILVDKYQYKPRREKYLCPMFAAATKRGVPWG